MRVDWPLKTVRSGHQNLDTFVAYKLNHVMWHNMSQHPRDAEVILLHCVDDSLKNNNSDRYVLTQKIEYDKPEGSIRSTLHDTDD